VSELVASLPGYRSVTFRKLTENQIERLEVVVRFLALLELYKQGLVDLEQADRFGDIQVRWIGNEAMATSAAMAIDDYEG
jgi:segregation and condensation protein A